MLSNYFKTVLRHLLKNKIYTFINIFGLAIGLASFLYISLYVLNEMSYDRFHEKAKNIHLVGFQYHIGSNQFDMALGPCPLAAALVNEFPEVETATRIFTKTYRGNYNFVEYDNKQYREELFFYADSSVFDVFTIPFISGNPKTALLHPYSIVLTPTMVKKYFGSDNPMGKMVKLEDGNLYTITGVVHPFPPNSHFRFDFLASFNSLDKSRDPDFYDTAVYTYIVLNEKALAADLEAKFPAFARQHYKPIIAKLMGLSVEEFEAKGNKLGFCLVPLLDLHLHSPLTNDFESRGDIKGVYIFIAIALIILIVACINFINLTTARSSQRANEVGVRKVVGSSRKQLVAQFLAESIFLCSVAVIMALVCVYLCLPFLNQLTGTEISLSVLTSWFLLPAILIFTLVVGTTAGSYPAFLLASFQPIFVLKGKGQSNSKGKGFRNALVVFQFTASIILFIGTIIISHQIEFMRKKNLGFNKEHVVVVQSAQKLGTSQISFKNNLLQHPDIISASYSDCLPKLMLEIKPFQKEGSASDENHLFITMFSDYDFIKTYQPELAQGRFFDKQFSTDSTAILLNEAAVTDLEFDYPLEKRLLLNLHGVKPLNVIGVFKDFHLEPLHYKIRPFAALLLSNQTAPLLSIRIRPGGIPKTLQDIEETWSRFVPGQPCEYVFYDEQFDKDYRAEIQSGKILTSFSALAIFIACLGLFGLASFTAEQRTKEIGIRKVFGATITHILTLLIKDFTKWLLYANLLAWPIAYFIMNKWLQHFAYRTTISWSVFIYVGIMTSVIAIGTITWQAIRAALSNPVESLKYE